MQVTFRPVTVPYNQECYICYDTQESQFLGHHTNIDHSHPAHESCLRTTLSVHAFCPLCRQQAIIDVEPQQVPEGWITRFVKNLSEMPEPPEIILSIGISWPIYILEKGFFCVAAGGESYCQSKTFTTIALDVVIPIAQSWLVAKTLSITADYHNADLS